MANTIYFISDAHLGAPFPDAQLWERTCNEFLRSLRGRAQKLYILGDLFDFWIEYRHAIRPDYFSTIHELRNLVESGVEVHYLAGNHDFALGPFIRERLGITVHDNEIETVLQGKKVYCHHGDGLLSWDVGYRIIKPILRNRVNQALYKLLPAYIGIPFAALCSGTSRVCSERLMNQRIADAYRNHAYQRLGQGSEVVFYAHSHYEELSLWGDKTYCNTGGWMRACTFATMEEGRVRLWRYHSGAGEEELPAIDRSTGNSVS